MALIIIPLKYRPKDSDNIAKPPASYCFAASESRFSLFSCLNKQIFQNTKFLK